MDCIMLWLGEYILVFEGAVDCLKRNDEYAFARSWWTFSDLVGLIGIAVHFRVCVGTRYGYFYHQGPRLKTYR